MKSNYFFLHKIVPFILKECDEYSFLPSIIISQAIIHSNNGSSELFKDANNIFAIKVNDEWVKHNKSFHKFRNNSNERYIHYKKYKNYEECIKDYLKKIDKRQHNFLYENYDLCDVAKNIFYNDRKTTQEYANMIISIIEENDLDDYDIYVTNISTMGRALNKLEKYDIIDSISYWFNSKVYINDIDKLLINASNKIKLSNKTNKRNINESIYKFVKNDIIKSESINYWINACEINGYIGELIRNIAVYLK